jgi:hypothetical protein
MTSTTRFAPQQLAGAAIMASLFALPTSLGVLALAKKMGTLVASPTAAVLVTIIVWLFFAACFSGRIAPTARPRIFAILADPALSIGAKLKATFTNWFSLLMIASQVLSIAALVLP